MQIIRNRKKTFIAAAIAVIMLLSMVVFLPSFILSAGETEMGTTEYDIDGDENPDTIYVITSVAQLKLIGNDTYTLDKNYCLDKDIDFTAPN